jgi:hypothetical protein
MKKNLFLYLALACFVGLIAIFVFDGYIGLYDNLHITTAEYEQTIEADQWELYENYKPSVDIAWGDKVLFSYQINNRRFSGYDTAIQVSLWKEDDKILDLVTEDTVIGAFDETQLEWDITTPDLEKVGLGIDNYTLKINQGDIERELIVRFYSTEDPSYPKPIPAPVR